MPQKHQTPCRIRKKPVSLQHHYIANNMEYLKRTADEHLSLLREPDLLMVIKGGEKGYEALMFGTKYYFFCSHCKEIVKVPLQEQYPECPICGRMDGLRTWNPVEGHCPKCGHSKLTETGEIIMAD